MDSLTTTNPMLGLIVGFSAMTGLLMGFDLSVIAVVVDMVSDYFELCDPDSMSCFAKNLFVSSIAPGALVGSLLSGWSADTFGRRVTLALSDFAFIIGSVILVLTESFAVLVLGRIIIGIGVGMGFVVFSTYVTEISPAPIRGRLVLCQEIAECIGVLMIFVLTSLIGDQHWRLMLGVGGLVALIQLAAIPGLAESPYWLLLQQRKDEAMDVFEKLEIPSDEVEALMLSYEQMRQSSLENLTGFKAIKRSRKRLGLAVFIGMAQNLMFTNAMLYYSTDLIVMGGLCQWAKWGLGIGFLKLVGIMTTFHLVDRIGRRKLLLWGTFGLSISDFILGIAYGSSQTQMNPALAWMECQQHPSDLSRLFSKAGWPSWLMLLGLFGSIFAWEVSWAGLMFVVASEILPSKIRGIGMGYVIFGFWLTLFVSQLVFEVLFKWITISGTFYCIGFIGIGVNLITYAFVPDMCARSLDLKDDSHME